MSLDLTGALTDKYYAEYRDYFASTEKIDYYVHDIASLIDEPSNTYSWSHSDGHEVIIEPLIPQALRFTFIEFLPIPAYPITLWDLLLEVARDH